MQLNVHLLNYIKNLLLYSSHYLMPIFQYVVFKLYLPFRFNFLISVSCPMADKIVMWSVYDPLHQLKMTMKILGFDVDLKYKLCNSENTLR